MRVMFFFFFVEEMVGGSDVSRPLLKQFLSVLLLGVGSVAEICVFVGCLLEGGSVVRFGPKEKMRGVAGLCLLMVLGV